MAVGAADVQFSEGQFGAIEQLISIFQFELPTNVGQGDQARQH
jgi:hypothetical protein